MKILKIEFVVLGCLLLMGMLANCSSSKSSKGDVSSSLEVMNEMEIKEDCFQEREAVNQISNQSGKVIANVDYYFIESDDLKRYTPCEMPEAFRVKGMRIVFSGTELAGDPRERRMGAAFHLTKIAAIK